MIYAISTKDFRLADKSLENVDDHVQKIVKVLPHYDADETKIDIVLEKHSKRRANRVRLEEVGEEEKALNENTPKMGAPVYYKCSINLLLPKKPLTVHSEGKDADQAINEAFGKLFKEVKKYKEKHFPSNSKYPNRDTLRNNGEYGSY